MSFDAAFDHSGILGIRFMQCYLYPENLLRVIVPCLPTVSSIERALKLLRVQRTKLRIGVILTHFGHQQDMDRL